MQITKGFVVQHICRYIVNIAIWVQFLREQEACDIPPTVNDRHNTERTGSFNDRERDNHSSKFHWPNKSQKDPIYQWLLTKSRHELCLQLLLIERILKGFIWSFIENRTKIWFMPQTENNQTNPKRISSINNKEKDRGMNHAFEWLWPNE